MFTITAKKKVHYTFYYHFIYPWVESVREMKKFPSSENLMIYNLRKATRVERSSFFFLFVCLFLKWNETMRDEIGIYSGRVVILKFYPHCALEDVNNSLNATDCDDNSLFEFPVFHFENSAKETRKH